MSYGRIYKITNLINNKEYIGQTTGSINNRFSAHCTENRNRHISNAIKLNGKDNFIINLIAEANDQKELNELEVYYVKFYNTMFPNGYNHRAGGNQNGVCSEELKNKISIAKLGKSNLKRRGENRSFEQRIKISQSLGGHKILTINVKTNETFVLNTANEGKKYNFNPSNIIQICKNTGRRKVDHGHTFHYIIDANQSGSAENNNSEHAQRIEIEPGIPE